MSGGANVLEPCIGATDFVPGHVQAAISYFFLPPLTCARQRKGSCPDDRLKYNFNWSRWDFEDWAQPNQEKPPCINAGVGTLDHRRDLDCAHSSKQTAWLAI